MEFNSFLWEDPTVRGSNSPPWKRSRMAHRSDLETSRLGLNLLLSNHCHWHRLVCYEHRGHAPGHDALIMHQQLFVNSLNAHRCMIRIPAESSAGVVFFSIFVRSVLENSTISVDLIKWDKLRASPVCIILFEYLVQL